MPTDIDQRSQNLRHLDLGMGLNLRVKNKRKVPRICCACIFAFVVIKNPKTLKLSPMADDAITQDVIGGLRSLVFFCCTNSQPCYRKITKKKMVLHVNTHLLSYLENQLMKIIPTFCL